LRVVQLVGPIWWVLVLRLATELVEKLVMLPLFTLTVPCELLVVTITVCHVKLSSRP
jgi:hypothetical protein